MKMMRFGLILVLGLLVSNLLLAQRSEIRKGNSEYESKNFGNAESSYRKALEKDPALFAGKYNLGNSLYRQDKMEEAARYYMEASAGERSAGEQSKAFYNMGNALMKADKYQEAVEAYKQALKLESSDEDARYNLSYALQMLRRQQQQQQQQQNKQDKQEKESGKDKQQQNQQDRQQEQKQQQQQANKQEQRKMSKEEAERMLKALRNDEKDLQKEKAKKAAMQAGAPLKNW
jgi:tetratricopeptide (TPR) repeat protein